LDHLAWQLVGAGGGTPNKDTYFPVIMPSPKATQQYASALGRGEIKRMRPGAEDALRAVQPFISGDATLGILHELDIVDKHRLLIMAVSSMDKWGVDVKEGLTLWFEENRYFPLQNGYEIVNIPTSTYLRQQQQDFQLGIDIAFGKPEIAEGNLVLPTLNKFADSVDSIVTRFEPFLS
jgi:hypothetical protein